MKGQKSRLSYSDQKVFLFRAQYIGFLRHIPAQKNIFFPKNLCIFCLHPPLYSVNMIMNYSYIFLNSTCLTPNA